MGLVYGQRNGVNGIVAGCARGALHGDGVGSRRRAAATADSTAATSAPAAAGGEEEQSGEDHATDQGSDHQARAGAASADTGSHESEARNDQPHGVERAAPGIGWSAEVSGDGRGLRAGGGGDAERGGGSARPDCRRAATGSGGQAQAT